MADLTLRFNHKALRPQPPFPTPDPTVCALCGGPEGLERRALSMTLRQVAASADAGCQVCSILRDSVSLEAEDSSDIVVQVPVFGAGFPLGVLACDQDGGYGSIELYTVCGLPTTPWPMLGEAPEVCRTADEAVPVLRTWIEECLATHPACKIKAEALPTRVIDVGSNELYLHISTGQVQPYAALSHCWGIAPTLETTTSTLGVRTQIIPWSSLSKTFQDAVTTTRGLGLSYLWIDSLCVIQDDPADWARESGRMASIYEGAQIVLAATSAVDGRDGFLGVRSDRNLPRTIFSGEHSDASRYHVRARQGDKHLWYDDPLVPHHLSKDLPPLSKRGWAFQERLLATRYVQFRHQELIWECKSSIRCECNTLSRPSQARTDTTTTKIAFYQALRSCDRLILCDKWKDIVDSYAMKHLTHQEDVLPALSGLAKQFQTAGCGTYLAGLWEDELPTSLLWQAQGGRAMPYRAPTWSWASVTSLPSCSSLNSAWQIRSPMILRATIQAVSITPVDLDPTGRVKKGHLIISGPMINIVVSGQSAFHSGGSRYDWDARLEHSCHDLQFKASPPFGFHADILLSDPKKLSCLLIAEYVETLAPRALVLRKLAGPEEVYERVGLIDRLILGSSIRSNNWNILFSTAQFKTVTIL